VHGSEQRIVVVTALFLAVLATRGLFVRLRDVRLTEHAFSFIDHIRMQVIEAMARAPWQRMPDTRRSEIEHAVNADIARIQTGANSALRLMSGLALVVAQIVAALVISWKLSLLSLAALAALAALRLPNMLRARSLGVEATVHGRRSYEVLSRFIAGLKLFKAHGLEAEFQHRYEASLASLRERRVSFARTQADNTFVIDLGAGIVVVAIVMLGVFWLALPITSLGLIVVIFARLSRLAFQFAQNLQNYLFTIPAFENVESLISTLQPPRAAEEATEDAPVPRAEAKTAIEGPLSLSVAEVTYSIPGRAPALLNGVSFALAPGEAAALMGRSGAGKTTLLDLVSGLLRPDAGRIEIAGRSVADGLPSALRSRIAYVPQDSVFFDGDLRENLTALSGPRSDAALWSALAAVGAEAIPAFAGEGLGARIGEQGQRLSGGERQRLGLARALLRGPGLLVLDEALSALDRESEMRVLEMLTAHGDMTVLLVTHRLPPQLRLAQVLQLAGGKIAPGGQGTAES
jgi:ATP-binding cassette subfamily C protein